MRFAFLMARQPFLFMPEVLKLSYLPSGQDEDRISSGQTGDGEGNRILRPGTIANELASGHDAKMVLPDRFVARGGILRDSVVHSFYGERGREERGGSGGETAPGISSTTPRSAAFCNGALKSPKAQRAAQVLLGGQRRRVRPRATCLPSSSTS